MTRFVLLVCTALLCSTNAFAVARWVNNQGATRPATVQLGCATYVTATTTYTNVQSAINAAVSGDIVYITDGVYNNPFEYTSTNCSYAGTAQDANLLFDLNFKSNIIITSSTGSYCNSNAVLRGKGFNFRSCNNVTVQGLRLDSIRVNAFYNSNCCGWGPSSNITIKDNSITNVRGHGIKTDDGGPTGVSINRGTWNITGNLFQNIGFYTANGLCSQASTTAIWLAEAGATFNINNNTIINTNWAGILCMGWGGDNGSYTGMLTVSGNRIDSTLDAGIQLGFPLGVFYYPNGANINNNKITHANYSNKIGIGALTMLANNVYGVTMTNNDISESFNGLAIEMAGWQNSFDVKNITYNNFYNLTSGSYAVTHIAGISPNGLFGTGDSLTKYNLANNYFGSATGPTYALNPGGTGTGLKKDANVLGGGTYSLGEFQFTPFATAPNTFVNPVSPCFSIPVAVNDNGATLAYNGANGVVNILTNDRDSNANPTAPVNGAGQFTLDLDIATIGLQTSFTNAQGVWTLNATTAEVTFDPALNYSGTAVLPYTLCDPSPTCNCVNANIQFIVNPCLTTMSTTDSAVCAAALPFAWNGITISTPGLDTAILVNAGGCDSLAIIDLAINPTSATTINDTICQGATYTFNGIAETMAGTYLDTMMNANGCDSFVTLNLVVNPTSATVINDTICQGATYTFNGIAETMAGTYLDTMMNANGCDSFITLNLFVKPTSATTINDTICQGANYTFNGITETMAGTYLDTMMNANGCDSFITLNLVVNPTSATTINDTICQGGTYTFNGIAETMAGTYLDTMMNANGCDSFITLNLVVNPTSATTINDTICLGGTYTFNGIAETMAGIYLDTMMNANGCDSFITLNLFIKPTSSAIINDTICQGDGYIFNGITQTMPGSYYDTLMSANGCDSLITLDLYVSALPIVIANVNDATICLGDTLLLSGSGAATYTWISPSETPTDNVAYVPTMSFSNSIYTVTGTSSAGCQSTSTISITVSALPNFTIIPNITPCSFGSGGSASISFTSGLSTPYTFSPSDGITISASDIDGIIGSTNYTITATNANSCIATSLLNIADFGNGNLANATATNATSTVGNTCASSNQIDGSFISYYGASCDDLIASVSDSTGGNVLGTVSTCVTINATAIQFALEPYSARWFDISPSSQGPALITLYFTQADFDGYNLVAPALSRPLLPTGPSDIVAFANMRVLKLSGGGLGVGTLPIEHVPGVTWNVLNNYWEVTIAIDSFSTFYLHTLTPPIPLAIDMQLSGSTTTTTDELSWSIANAKDIVNYDVQILQNGEFKALATVAHTAQQREYSYRNNALATNTYRIAANTSNGLQKYSNTITLQRSNTNSLAVYPNPATNIVTIDVHAMSGSNATIHVYDIAGKLVLTNYFTLLQGGNTHTIDLSALANGTYTIKVSDAKAWHAQTLLQKH
ncbi:MAG: hypothetical protein RL660_1356 [Bacteroidota bacterium]|jgi:hypothetical protein